jgi:hypothetical protein
MKVKRSETENLLTRNNAKKHCFNFALVGSEKFEAKRSEKNNFCLSVRNACETDLVSLRFAMKRKKKFFCETSAP